MSALVALRRKLAAASRWSASDWRVAAEALVELARADALVTARRYAVWRPVLEATAGSGDAPVDPRVVRVFESVAANYPRRANCLRRAIALRAMLVRRGCPARIRFGVRRDGAAAIDAHAWVDVRGEPVETRSDVRGRYVPLHATGGRAA